MKKRIYIQSNVELEHPITRFKGIVDVEIKIIQRKPYSQKQWTLEIQDIFRKQVDSGEVDEDGNKIFIEQKEVHKRDRLNTYTDQEISQLISVIGLNRDDYENEIDFYDDLFRHALLIKTQMECQAGVGLYFSEAQNWFIPSE